MKRRSFIAAAGSATLLGACGQPQDLSNQGTSKRNQKTYKWNMITTWPPGFQGLGTGAEYLAKLIEEMSSGRIRVKVLMGHGGAYYWKGKLPAAPFFCAVPFGLEADQMNAWLLKSDGLQLWQELYAPFNLVPMPAGNTGMHRWRSSKESWWYA